MGVQLGRFDYICFVYTLRSLWEKKIRRQCIPVKSFKWAFKYIPSQFIHPPTRTHIHTKNWSAILYIRYTHHHDYGDLCVNVVVCVLCMCVLVLAEHKLFNAINFFSFFYMRYKGGGCYIYKYSTTTFTHTLLMSHLMCF